MGEAFPWFGPSRWFRPSWAIFFVRSLVLLRTSTGIRMPNSDLQVVIDMESTCHGLPNCGLVRLFPDGILILHVHANPSCLLQSKSNPNLETRNITVSQKGKELGMYMIRSPSKRRRVPPRRLQRTIQPDIILSRATAERRRPPGVPIR
jgi:hypothetical protein